MVLTKNQKQWQITKFADAIAKATSVVLFVQKGVGVNNVNDMRKDLSDTDGTLMVVRKRLFMRAINEAWYEAQDIEKLDGTLFVLLSHEDEVTPLKAVNKSKKAIAKFKKADKSLNYIGWWFEKTRKDADYVAALADLPSKEELVWKFLYLLKYPVQSFVAVLDQIAEKKEWGVVEKEEGKENETTEEVA